MKVVSIPLSCTLFCLVEIESKSCKHLSQTPNVFYTFARNKACDPPLFGLKPRNFNATTTTFMKLLFDSVFHSVLVYCFFLKLGIIDLPYHLGSFDTNYIIFRNVEIFPQKNLN
jgi:hypothetical protein